MIVCNIFFNNKGKRVYRRLAFFYKFYKRGDCLKTHSGQNVS